MSLIFMNVYDTQKVRGLKNICKKNCLMFKIFCLLKVVIKECFRKFKVTHKVTHTA